MKKALLILYLICGFFCSGYSQVPGPVAAIPNIPINNLPLLLSYSTGVPVLGPSNLLDNGTSLLYKGSPIGGVAGVSGINSVAGSFIFTGAGVTCVSTTCTFSGGGGGATLPTNALVYGTSSSTSRAATAADLTGLTGLGSVAAATFGLTLSNLPSGLSFTSFTTSTPTQELGATVTNPVFSSAFSGATVTGSSITNTDSVASPTTCTTPFTSCTITGTFSHSSNATVTFTDTITGSDGTSPSRTATVSWYPRFFGGVGTAGATGATSSGTSAVLTGATGTLASLGIAATQTGTFSFTPSSQYIYLILQGSSHTFTVNTFATTFTSTAISFTNINGVSVPTEYLYVSPTFYTGTYTVGVN